MSFGAFVKSIYLDRDKVAHRPAQLYDDAVGAYDIFEITGPVLIYALGGRATAAAGGASTVATTINGVAGEAGAVAINGAVGTVWATPLNVAGVIAGAAGGLPFTDALLHPKGFLAGIGAAANGVIVFTFGAATWTGDIFCVYRALSPDAMIIPA